MSRANPSTTHDNAGIASWNFKLKAEIRSYDDCRQFVQENDPDCVMAKLGPQMQVLLLGDGHREVYKAFQDQTRNWDDIYAIVLYETEIIRYYPDGTFSVDNGGHNTPTTNERLQAVLPDGFRCYHHQKRLGLVGPGGRWATRAKPENQPEGVLWPLDHTRRIALNGKLVEQ